MNRTCAFASFLALLTLAPAQAKPAGAIAYSVTRAVALGAPDSWDYVTFDASSQRVFVAHGDRLTVVDGRSGVIVGQVEGAPGGTHGIALVPSIQRGYTDDGEAGRIKVFDMKTLKIVDDLPAQPDADGAILDPTSGHIFVMTGDSGKVTIVDPKTDRVLANVDAGGKLEFAASGHNGKVYVEGEEKREIVRIDASTNQIDAKWPIKVCESPHGLAIDTDSHRLFASCANSKLVVINADDGSVVATLPIGQGTDATAFDPGRHLIFSSNGRSGDITVIREVSPSKYIVAGTVKTFVTARTMSIDPVSGRLYVVAGEVEKASSTGGRPKLVPGSLKLYFLDPADGQRRK